MLSDFVSVLSIKYCIAWGESFADFEVFDQPHKFHPRNICPILQFTTVLLQSTKPLNS